VLVIDRQAVYSASSSEPAVDRLAEGARRPAAASPSRTALHRCDARQPTTRPTLSDDEFDELPATRPATAAEQARLAHLVAGLFAELGATPTSARDDVTTLAAALRDGRLSPTAEGRPLAIGAALGMALAYELALGWVHVPASELGRPELALEMPAGRSAIFEHATWFPISMVEQRALRGLDVDPLDLYDRAVRWAADVEGADADQVSSWGPYGDQLLDTLSTIEPREAIVQAGIDAMQVVLERLVERTGGHSFLLDRHQHVVAIAPRANIDASSGEATIPPLPNAIGRLVASVDERLVVASMIVRSGTVVEARLATALIRRIVLRMVDALGERMPMVKCTDDELKALFAAIYDADSP
jgi:hypothetical protein